MVTVCRLSRTSVRWGGPVLLVATFAAGVGAGILFAPADLLPAAPANAASSPALVAEVRPLRTFGVYPAELVRVIDGDTFEARVNVWPGIDITTECACAASTRRKCADVAPRNSRRQLPRATR